MLARHSTPPNCFRLSGFLAFFLKVEMGGESLGADNFFEESPSAGQGAPAAAALAGRDRGAGAILPSREHGRQHGREEERTRAWSVHTRAVARQQRTAKRRAGPRVRRSHRLMEMAPGQALELKAKLVGDAEEAAKGHEQLLMELNRVSAEVCVRAQGGGGKCTPPHPALFLSPL